MVLKARLEAFFDKEIGLCVKGIEKYGFFIFFEANVLQKAENWEIIHNNLFYSGVAFLQNSEFEFVGVSDDIFDDFVECL